MDSPECNDADNDWYVRMPTNLPVDPKDEMLLELCDGQDVILEPSLHIEMGMYAEIRVTSCLSAQLNMQQPSPERLQYTVLL